MRKRLAVWGVFPVVALIWQIDRHWTELPRARLDFHIYYDAVRSMDATNLYDFRASVFPLGFTYPPAAAFVLRPLTELAPGTAEHVWLVLSALLSAAFAVLAVRTITGRPGGRSVATAAVMTALILASMPVSLTLRLGQINALIAALVALDAVLISRRSSAGGISSGFAAAIKVTPALMVPALFLMRRRADAMRAIAAGAAATVAAAVVAPRETWRYFSGALFDTRRVGHSGDFNNSLSRLMGSLHGTDSVWIVAGLVVMTVACSALAVRRAAERGDIGEAVTVTMLCSYLVSPITWGHHVFFFGPAVFLLWMRRDPISRLLALAGTILLLDPFEGGQGEVYSMWRIGFMGAAVFVLAVTEPRQSPLPVQTPAPRQWAGSAASPPSAGSSG